MSLVILFAPASGKARDIFVSGGAGMAMPLGGYTELSENGYNAFFEVGAYMDRKHYGGFFGRYLYFSAPLKNENITLEYAPEVTGVPNGDFTAHCFLPGYYRQFPINRKTAVEARLMLGALYAEMPKLKSEDGTITYRTEDDAITFAAELALGFRYSPVEFLDLIFETSYLNSAPIFFDEADEFGDENEFELKRDIHQLNINIGLRFNF